MAVLSRSDVQGRVTVTNDYDLYSALTRTPTIFLADALEAQRSRQLASPK